MTVRSFFIGCAAVALGFLCVIQASERATASTILGMAESFAVLGASTVTNTGATTVNGDLGVYPGTAITGAGTISLTGTTHDADAVAQQAQLNATAAYNILAGLASTSLASPNLGGLTLTPGVYSSSSTGLTGTLTLNFNNVSNTDIVLLIASTLITASNSQVIVENGNSTDGVFFDVGSSATLGTGTAFEGNILALDSITLTAGASLCGRGIALTGAVTMDSNTVSTSCSGDLARASAAVILPALVIPVAASTGFPPPQRPYHRRG